MLSNTELEFKTADVLNQDYEAYLLGGGRFPYEDFKYITDILAEDNPTPLRMERCPCTSQIGGISQLCNIEISPKEILIYRRLRRKMRADNQLQETLPNTCNPWQMHDLELVREIFLLTDPTREKYQIVTEKFPHMFGV
jgi:hypothetical protein